MIDFTLTENDQKILDYVRREALALREAGIYYDRHEEEVAPAHLIDREEFPGPMSLYAGRTDEDTPGAVMGMLQTIHSCWGDSLALFTGDSGLGNAALGAAGTDEQKAKWGGLTLAMSITEPGVGSDTKAVQTTAELDGDEWVLNGDKIFVTTGVRAAGAVVWASIDRSAGRAGIKSFLVLKDTPGFTTVRKEKKLGIRGSDTAAYNFDNCRIPRDHLLGGDETVPKAGSGGFRGVMRTFNITRPAVAASGIGAALAGFEFARDELAKEQIEVDWYESRLKRSTVEDKLIEIEADIEAATLAVCRAGYLAGKGIPNNTESSISKAKGGEVARTATQRCIDLLGAMGTSQEYLMEKWFRDARICDIYEGTGQIQRLIIARDILEFSSEELN